MDRTDIAQPPDVRAAASRGPRPSDEASPVELRGQVRHVEFHAAPREFGAGAQDWLTFHLHAPDPESHRPHRIRVMVRSNRVSELVIRDGDTVVVRGERTGRTELAATFVENVTTRSRLDLSGGRRWIASLRAPLGVLSVLAVPAFILAVVAMLCSESATGVRVGVPCLVVWLAFWALSRYRR